jgi:hypothetical protein
MFEMGEHIWSYLVISRYMPTRKEGKKKVAVSRAQTAEIMLL